MKKLIPALVMLLVSAVVLSTASYAWFTTSNVVTADGMSVTATAPSSILIRGKYGNGETDWTDFSNTLTFTDLYETSAKLTPASSSNGYEFYIPANSYDAAGAMEYMTNIGAASTGGTFYYDFEVELKNDSVNTIVDISVKSITNALTSSAMKDVVRVAIITGDATAEPSTTKPTASDANTTIYTNDGYTPDWVIVPSKDANGNVEYLETNKATGPIAGPITVVKEATQGTPATTYVDWKTVAAGTTTDPYTDLNTVIATLNPQEYVRVTIRVWFEGQDHNCVSSKAGASAKVSVQFGIEGDPREYVAPTPQG